MLFRLTECGRQLCTLLNQVSTMNPDYEQLAQEAAIWPWLDSDCMADEVSDAYFTDRDYYPEDNEDD
jgi:hypothetical protein